MTSYYNEFLELLVQEDKPGCLKYVLTKLEMQEIDIPTLYEEVIAPALNSIECHNDEMQLCVWKEHIRSAIVRTIIECCYPYILKHQSTKSDLSVNSSKRDVVAVLCPDGESHELGARMVTDLFTISGFDTVFIGSSTPKQEYIQVIQHIKPKYIAVSVTNYFNLIAAKKTIELIKAKVGDQVKILVGGNAFARNPEQAQLIGANRLIHSFADIQAIAERGV